MPASRGLKILCSCLPAASILAYTPVRRCIHARGKKRALPDWNSCSDARRARISAHGRRGRWLHAALSTAAAAMYTARMLCTAARIPDDRERKDFRGIEKESEKKEAKESFLPSFPPLENVDEGASYFYNLLLFRRCCMAGEIEFNNSNPTSSIF